MAEMLYARDFELSTTPMKVAEANRERILIAFHNRSTTVDCWLGGPDVSPTGKGFRVGPRATPVFDGYDGPVWMCASTSATVSIVEAVRE